MTEALSLLHNVGLLALGAVILFLALQRLGVPVDSRRRQVLLGAVLGLIAVLVVSAPVPGPFGATFDTRAGPVVLAGFFGGPLGAAIAAGIAGAARFAVGGPAVLGGVSSVFLYAAAGYAFRKAVLRRQRIPLGPAGFLALSATATLAVLPSFFIGQSWETGATILSRFWPLLLLGNAIGVTLLGVVLTRIIETVDQRDQFASFLQTSEVARRAAGIGIWRYDLHRDRLEWDPVQHEMMGVPPTEFGGNVDAFRALVDPEDLPRIEAAFRVAHDSRTSFHDQLRVRVPGGGVKHLSVHADFFGSSDEEAGFVMGVNIDRTREVLLQAELTLKSAAVDSAVCGILIAEAGGDMPMVFVNRAFSTITGYAPEEVLGRNFGFLHGDLDHQPGLDDLRRAIAGRQDCAVILRNRRKDGTEFWNALRISPIRDAAGEVTHFLGVQEDVTGQVQSRQSLSDARDELHAILAAAPDAMITVGEDQCITSFNAAATRLFGWRAEEIVGRPHDMLVPEGVRGGHAALVAEYIASPLSEPGAMRGIIRARRKDGSTFPARISLARFVASGRPAVALAAHDLTDIVAAQETLEELSDRLREQLLAARAANLAKSQFLASMSHELRTPLNAILGFAEMIREFGPDRLGAARTLEYVGHIEKGGSLLLDLINDVLDLSRIETAPLPLHIGMHDVAGIVEAALDIVAPMAQAKGVSLDHARTTDGTAVRCDRRALQQCLLNLLSNAIKFSPAGAAVSIRVAAKDGDLRLTVSDSGPGFPDELTSRIGEPFLRLTDANVASAEGSGLGLAITRKLVEQQDGALAICSGADGGTEATITLPLGGPGSRESNVPRSRAGTGPDAVATASPVLLA